jgi:serpin B
VLSPTSIYLALSMAAEGARGETATQMQKVLGPTHANADAQRAFLQELTNPLVKHLLSYRFTLSNGLWVQKGFGLNAGYVASVRQNYLADVAEIDFAKQTDAARKTINDAIAKQTKDKIKDLLAPGALTPQTRLVLTNAVYLKAPWAEPFEATATHPAAFHPLDGSVAKDVPTMHQTKPLKYFENDHLKLLELPYEGGELSMLLVLSKDADVKKSLAVADALGDLNTLAGQASIRSVTVALPKFKFDSSMELSSDLKAMGMTDAFSSKADFSGIASHEKLAIDEVIHKAYIDVNEAGTEAAAATAVTMRALAMPAPREPADFIADKPFVFAIRQNQTGAILFAGRVVKP